MMPPRPAGQLTPSRVYWVVPLAFGVGGTLALIFMILVGIGYDMIGRTPGPIVVTGLALLAAPMLFIARTNFRDYRGQQELLQIMAQLSPKLLDHLAGACKRHGDEFIEDAIAAFVRELDRQGGRRSITVKMAALPREPDADV